MTENKFQQVVSVLSAVPFREDFEASLHQLYLAVSPEQRDQLRTMVRAGTLKKPRQWKNPADFDRSDLTREQRMRHELIEMSINSTSSDYRDDLMSIAFYYHNLLARGVDANAELEAVAQLSDAKFAGTLRNFNQRPAEKNTLESWHLRIVQKPDGPVTERYK